MRKILLTSCIILGTIGLAKAQLNKSSFIAEVNALGAAIDQKSLKEEVYAIDLLEKMATNEINYCRVHSSAKNDANVPVAQNMETYLGSLPKNTIIANKKITVTQLNGLVAKIQ